MSNKQKIYIMLGAIVIIGISFVGGLFLGQKKAQKNNLAVSKVYGQTFYANIRANIRANI